MIGLFEQQAPRPLADRLRPKNLAEVVGQDHLLRPDGAARAHGGGAAAGFDDPVGTAGLRQDHHRAAFGRGDGNAVSSRFPPCSRASPICRKLFDAAKKRRLGGQGTLLFVDEIHRFNRAQQDGFLPYVEDGTVTLIGATTENPSFELNGALLSRCQVFVLHRLDEAALETLLARAEAALRLTLPLDDGARQALKAMADGDGRFVLNLAEELAELPKGTKLDTAGLMAAVQKRAPLYDKAQEGHYNLISALHKSVRGSDVDAALYWLARMLAGGEHPIYIARRLVRMAVEDVGMADPRPRCHRRSPRGKPMIAWVLPKANWRWRRR